MAYYLGRDVKVYLAVEMDGHDLYVGDNNLTIGNAAGVGTPNTQFASDRDYAMDSGGLVTDLTGVDLGIGATDEDISFIGLRTVLKAEIKKETTLSLTRKKLDGVWDVVFNGDGTNTLRWGISGAVTPGSTANVYTGLEKPTINYGYRLHIVLKSSGEVFCIRNCQITGHTTSISVDGVQEETMEFMSSVDPVIKGSGAAYTTVTDLTEL